MTVPFLPYVFQRLLATTMAAWRLGRDRRQLKAMSDNELRDLGIGRSEIPGLVGQPQR